MRTDPQMAAAIAQSRATLARLEATLERIKQHQDKPADSVAGPVPMGEAR